MQGLLDYLKSDLKIIFIGFNPGIRSSKTGHHYAHPTNKFYKLLFESKLTPRLFKPEEDYKLLELGYGLTNIVKRATRSADKITNREYIKGKENLIKKLKKYKPEVACFTGIGVYREYSQKSNVTRGLQNDSIVQDIKEFVVSSPSGLNRTPYSRQLKYYKKLYKIIEK